MAQFTTYASTDASAPVLTGEVGSLVALLDACLVNGYGSKAAAGWAKSFSGTNKAAYRPGAGTRMYLRIQDDGPGIGGAREARATGYEVMTTVDAGTGPFPTAAQGVGGVAMVPVRKSDSLDNVPRPWIVFADSRTMYLLIQWGSTAVYNTLHFGDFYSTATGDTYNCSIVGKTSEVSTGAAITSESLDKLSVLNAAVAGSFAPRSYSGTGTSVTLSRHGDAKNSATVTVGIQSYPNTGDNGLYLSRITVGESALSNVRGSMRGLWHFCHAAANINNLDTFSGTGALAGRTFVGFKSGNSGVMIFETSNTLETN